MTLYDEFLELLDQAIEKYGSANKLAEALQVPANLITRWKNRERAPRLTTIQPLMNLMKVQGFSLADANPAKNVCFVDAKLVDSENGEPPLKAEDYSAIPMIGEVGAGIGFLPEESIKSWFLVHNKLPAVRYRRNLVAVQIGSGSTSMQPTLNPGDIVLVDRSDRDISNPGKMMLVMDPLDGSGMVKRVGVREQADDFILTFYSDNAVKWPPLVYSLNSDYGGDWDKAIAGRVIWAWADMREK